MNKHNSEKISIPDAADKLKVSEATIKNWLKIGIISDKELDNEGIIEIKRRIDSGKIKKLNSRVNKVSSKKTFIPNEYFTVKNDIILFREFLDTLNNVCKEFSLVQKLALISLLYLKSIGYYKDVVLKTLIDNIRTEPKNNLETELKEWLKGLKSAKYNLLENLQIPEIDDFLGLVYQSLSHEGNKSEKGSYYTPNELVNNIVVNNLKGNEKVLDPACGTGKFLINYAKVIKNYKNIWGFDYDEIAVKIAKINLFVHFNDFNIKPNIYKYDFILNTENQYITQNYKFDFIATNPPWGAKFSKEQKSFLRNNYPNIKSFEAFSYFIVNSFDLLKNNGKMCFILPYSILNVKSHNDIRKFIIDNSCINVISMYGKIFKNVFSDVIQIDITKQIPEDEHKIEIKNNNKTFYVKQSVYKSNDLNVFNISADSEELKIISFIYSQKHFTLKDKADFALGVVTGNNSEISENNKIPILKGADIKKFTIKSPKNYINSDNTKFQQIAPLSLYNANEKLIYRFISKNLVFAYDNKKYLTLNSANIVIPKVDNYNIKIFVALFNSRLYNFLFQKKYSSIKVLRHHLESLPIPVLSEEQKDVLVQITDEFLSGNECQNKLDKFVYSIFELTPEMIKIIEQD